MKRTFLILVACLVAPFSFADQHDPELGKLFERLQETRNAVAAAPIEARIWDLWTRHEDPEANRLMRQGLLQMNANALEAAVATYTQLIEAFPDFAEAWNKRATLYYLMGNNAGSKADIEEVLKREPYHFGALSGLGLVHIALGEYFEARSAFNSALEVNPGMDAVRENLRQLDGMLGNRAI